MGRIFGLAKMAYRPVRPLKERLIAGLACGWYKNSRDREIREVMGHVEKTGHMRAFNYPFARQYRKLSCDIKKDRRSGMYFTDYHGRPLYFSRECLTAGSCREYLRGILAEQDADSPHRYLTDSFNVDAGSVVVDAGAAEGNFSLDAAGRAARLILVECSRDWIEALEKTFAAEIAENKVVIVPKMLSDKDNEKEVTLDALFTEYGRIDFVKMDIEGGEEKALRGGVKWMGESRRAKLAVCTYHTPGAYRGIRNILKKQFTLEHSRGYMYFNEVFHYRPPYLRRGLIRAVKK